MPTMTAAQKLIDDTLSASAHMSAPGRARYLEERLVQMGWKRPEKWRLDGAYDTIVRGPGVSMTIYNEGGGGSPSERKLLAKRVLNALKDAYLPDFV